MSRSGYTEDLEMWDLIRWRGAVSSAIRGRRGRKLLEETFAALDAMPEKRLIAHELIDESGDRCALGVVGRARGIDVSIIDPDDYERVAAALDIAEALARELVYVNDEATFVDETPEDRWRRVRAWVEETLATARQPGKERDK